MTLVQAIDLVIAQTEKAIQINANNGRLAFAEGYINYYDKTMRFSKQLNMLHIKLIVARAEITDLCTHGCVAVCTDDQLLEEINHVETR